MPALNKLMLMGNVVRSPELHFEDGERVCDVALAINDKEWTRGGWVEEVTFLQVRFTGSMAETLAGKLRRGEALFCEAKVKQVEGEPGPRGGRTKKTRVIGTGFQFLSGSSNRGEGGV